MFAVVVVLTLAVGIGVNVAVFSLFDRSCCGELNVAHPHELVKLVAPGPQAEQLSISNEQGTVDETFSYPMFRDLERAGAPYVGSRREPHDPSERSAARAARRRAAACSSRAGTSRRSASGPSSAACSAQPDVADGPAATVVLSYDYWRTAYGADPACVGQTLVVERPSADDRRRRAAWLRRHDARRRGPMSSRR